MSFRATVACSRAQGEAIGHADDILTSAVLVADEPDPARPDDWLIHAYFEHAPTGEELAELAKLGRDAPRVEQLGEADWVTMSQAGLQPIVGSHHRVAVAVRRRGRDLPIRLRET